MEIKISLTFLAIISLVSSNNSEVNSLRDIFENSHEIDFKLVESSLISKHQDCIKLKTNYEKNKERKVERGLIKRLMTATAFLCETQRDIYGEEFDSFINKVTGGREHIHCAKALLKHLEPSSTLVDDTAMSYEALRDDMSCTMVLFGDILLSEYVYIEPYFKGHVELEKCGVHDPSARKHYYKAAIIVSARNYDENAINELKENFKTFHQKKNLKAFECLMKFLKF